MRSPWSGSDARRGKLTLFTAEGPREQGAFKHVALRVSDLERATADLPSAELELGEGVRVQLVEAPTDVEYDLDHVALVLGGSRTDGEGVHCELGFDPAEPSDGHPRVEVGGAYVEFHRGDPGEPDKPLLNHVAVLVDEVDP